MANPRLTVGFEGLDAEYVTMEIDNSSITFDGTKVGGSAQVGLAVTFSAAGTVALVADADHVVGKLISVERDGFCTVQTRGTMTLPGGDGATLTLNLPIVGDLGPDSAKGYVRIANSAVAAELAKARGEIRDATTTTAVVVSL